MPIEYRGCFMMSAPTSGADSRTASRLKTFYLFYFAAGGALIPFLNLYLARVGLSGTEIGIVSGVIPIVTILAVPLWSVIGDLTRLHTRILYVTLGASIPFVVAIAFTRSLGVLLVLVAGYAFFMSPGPSLVDSLSMRCLGARQERYGRLRVWGAVGWGISAPAVGYLIRATRISVIFYSYAALLLFGLTALIGLTAPGTDSYRPPARDFRRLLKSPSWQVFLFSIFLAGVCSNVLEHYLVLFLDDLGGSEWSFGVSVAMASLSEIPVFLLSGLFIRRRGARGLLLSALFIYAVRAGVYAGIRNPLVAIPAQLLHGPTFSALWVAGVVYAAVRAPSGLEATAQAAFNTVFMGAAAASGAVLGGVLYDTVGLARTFLICGGMSLLGFLLLLFFGRSKEGQSTVLSADRQP
jgi:PPP family 3-phenylpropionic acid transporter